MRGYWSKTFSEAETIQDEIDQAKGDPGAAEEYFQKILHMLISHDKPVLRLAKKFCTLARIYGENTDSGLRIDLKLSQEEWGDLVGTTRESINKQLKAWTNEGILSTSSGYIVIHRMQELDRLADALLY